MTTILRPGERSRGPATRRELDWMLMAAAFALTGASQLVSQLVLGRLLGPSDYGQVATLFNLMSLVGVPIVAVQLTVTGLVARGGSSHDTLSRLALAGAGLGLVAMVASPWWRSGLALDSVGACRVATLFLPATFVLAVARGNAVGQGRTRPLAAAMTAAAVVRVVASVVGSRLFGVVGATAAAVASEVVLGVVLLVVVRSVGERRGPIVARETAGATYSQVAMWLVVNVDLLWARRLLSAPDAGRYLVVGSVSVGLVSFGQAFLWHHASASTDASAGAAIVRARRADRRRGRRGRRAGRRRRAAPAARAEVRRAHASPGDQAGLGGARLRRAGRHGDPTDRAPASSALLPVAVVAIVAPPCGSRGARRRPIALSFAAAFRQRPRGARSS
ncbi:MAG: hypothetical protein U0S36_00095 [Candidatus Nanopelagicales bacterium]